MVLDKIEELEAQLLREQSESRNKRSLSDRLGISGKRSVSHYLRGDKVRNSGMSKPQEYHGKEHKLQAFLTQCDMYLEMNNHQYCSDRQRVLFVASFFWGMAGQWWSNVLRHYPRPNFCDDYQLFL